MLRKVASHPSDQLGQYCWDHHLCIVEHADVVCVIIIVINYLYNNWTEHMHVWLESRLSLFLYSCLSLLFYLTRILYWQLYIGSRGRLWPRNI